MLQLAKYEFRLEKADFTSDLKVSGVHKAEKGAAAVFPLILALLCFPGEKLCVNASGGTFTLEDYQHHFSGSIPLRLSVFFFFIILSSSLVKDYGVVCCLVFPLGLQKHMG